MSGDEQDAIDAFRGLSTALERLRELGIIRSRRFTGDIGEWLVATLYEAELAASRTQKGWDMRLPTTGHRLQVKAQSFDPGNQWNYLDSDPEHFDRLVVAVLTDALKLKLLFDVPVADLRRVLRTGKEGKPSYHFVDLRPWRVDVSKLPGFVRVADLVEREDALSVRA